MKAQKTMKWHVFVKGRYIGSVLSTLEDTLRVLKRPHIVRKLGHSIDIL